MCCNSFHLMKGVEPQWNYGYSGASVGHHVGHKESWIQKNKKKPP